MKRCSSVWGILLATATLGLFTTRTVAAQVTQYYVPKPAPVALRFNALDPTRAPIDEQWLLQEVAGALQAKSGQPLKSAGGVTTELAGLRTRVDAGQSQIVFEYVHVARNRVGEEWGETLSIPVAYQIENGKDVITIRLRPPQMAQFATRRTPAVFFMPTPKLGSIEDLFDDFGAIMDGAHTLELRHSVLLKGEEQANTAPQACIDKFDRVLGRYGYGKDEERVFDPKHDDVFLYRTAQESVAVKVAALHFRGGTKVVYEAWVPFELRADGTVKGYALAPALKTDVHRILEDPPTREAAVPVDAR